MIFEGDSDDAMWYDMTRNARQTVHYMTPKLVSRRIVVAKISSGSATLRVPVDSISQVVRRETVSSDRTPAEHIAIGIGFFAGVAALIALATLVYYLPRGW